MLPEQILLVHAVILFNLFNILHHHYFLGETALILLGRLLVGHRSLEILTGPGCLEVGGLVLGQSREVVVASCVKTLIH